MEAMDFLAGADVATNLASFGYGVYNAERNFNFQKENLDYQKKLQERLFEREDNAMQRKIEDYKKAGFSPLQALGGAGAGAGSVVNTTAPYADTPQIQGTLLDYSRQKNEIKAQRESIKGVQKENDIKDMQYNLLKLDYEKQSYDFAKYQAANLPTTTKVSPLSIAGGYLGNNAQSIAKATKNFFKKLGNDINVHSFKDFIKFLQADPVDYFNIELQKRNKGGQE